MSKHKPGKKARRKAREAERLQAMAMSYTTAAGSIDALLDAIAQPQPHHDR
ncbi:hypothetical protein [Sulfuriroseicoccus oceanibius]|uniref:Uncharacterized protein n=1 Tax=Sulfuriroseicoccus oceanibius TaxID=2707525 RepID=A0A6B3L5H7_9BACT|nr:hypothetical protein [Sulfuriroseicoccus oceanibius]QQL44240.1 hypothetical protein G3M56_010075 [Sulfuriroseicoccus oceanibius]